MKSLGLRRFAAIAVGYLAATAASSLVALVIMDIERLIEGRADYFTSLLAVGFAVTTVVALPGFIAMITYSERYKKHAPLWYALAGILTALLSTVLLSIIDGAFLFGVEPRWLGGLVGGGMAGGLTYWAVTGRKSARQAAKS